MHQAMVTTARYSDKTWTLERFHTNNIAYIFLSYDITVIQWITSCHKNCKTTRVVTIWHERVMSLTVSMSTMRFLLK